MADKKSRVDADRLLNEYERQLKAHTVFENKFPSITKAVDPFILNKTDEEIYNKLGENTQKSGPNLFAWVRDAERNAGNAAADDYYLTRNPQEILNQIKKENNVDADLEYGEAPNVYAKTFPPLDLDKEYPQSLLEEYKVLSSLPTKIPKIILTPQSFNDKQEAPSTIHEAEHVKDIYKNYPAIGENRFVKPNGTFDLKKYSEYKDKPLYDVSDYTTTGHFSTPRSAVINDMINRAKQLGAKEGLEYMPDDNSKYDELESIKPILKDLEPGHPKHDPSLFQKLKNLLK